MILKSFNHLSWQCRRGMLELDEILFKFLNTHYTELSLELKLKFNQLLEASDADLFDWLLNKSLPSNIELIDLIIIIRKNLLGSKI